MKIVIYTLILVIGFTSCNRLCQNKLDHKFESKVAFYESVIKTEISKTDTTEKRIREYRIGYNSDSLEVIIGKSNYIEYDSKGRIIKRYWCLTERDPCCKRPFKYIYQYNNGKIEQITRVSSFRNETTLYEKYIYDNHNRLKKKFSFPTDTTTFFYNLNDTLPFKQVRVSRTNNMDGDVVRLVRTTTCEYDSLGLKTRETWKDKSGLSLTTQFIYDSKKRLVIEKDSSLNDEKNPNAYILFWTKYKYDNRDRIIEELNLGGTIKEPEPHFRFKKTFEFKEI